MPAIRRVAVTETVIREHAYHLWERDGRPFGRDLEYWSRASNELAALVERAKPAKAAEAPKATDRAAAATPATKVAAPKPAAIEAKAGAPKTAAGKPAPRRPKA
jgi:hypothetical protein